MPFPLALSKLMARLSAVCLAGGLAWPAVAAPVPVDAEVPPPALPWLGTGVSKDIEHLARDEATQAILTGAIDRERHAALVQGWQPRPPTWVQAAAHVNLGDYAGRDDMTAKAERDLEVMNWVIQQQQRLPTEHRVRSDDGNRETRDTSEASHWLQPLTSNREWVMAAGTILLLVVWGASRFARRPGAAPPLPPPGGPRPVKSRRRRRRSARLW